MSKVIDQLTELTTPDAADLLLIEDTSTGESKKITIGNLSDEVGAVKTVNSENPDGAGNVAITPDNLSDAGTTNKFVTAAQKAKIDKIVTDGAGDTYLDSQGNYTTPATDFASIGGSIGDNAELTSALSGKATPADISAAIDAIPEGWDNYPYAEIWISLGGNDSNSGSKDSPLATWDAAWTMRKLAPDTRYKIIFDSGIWINDMVFDDIGSDTSETYIQGLQDGNFPRWSSGANNIVMTNAGWIYFVGFGYYGSIQINQTGARICAANFINVFVYGTVSTTGIADPALVALMIEGSNGLLHVKNTSGTIAVPLITQNGGRMSMPDGSLTINRIRIKYGGAFFVPNSKNLTVDVEFDVYDGSVYVLGNGVLTVTGDYAHVNMNMIAEAGGSWDFSAGTEGGNSSWYKDSEFLKYRPAGTALVSGTVQEAITELDETKTGYERNLTTGQDKIIIGDLDTDLDEPLFWFKNDHSTLPENKAGGWINIAIGTGLMADDIDGGANIAIGSNSLQALINTGGGEWGGSENISLGRGNGTGITDGSQNVLIGRACGGGTSGNFAYSFLSGYEAGFNVVGTNLTSQTAIGIYAMKGTTLNDSDTIAIGSSSYNGATVNGNSNVGLGTSVFRDATFDGFNVAIGWQALGAGSANFGESNIAIGLNAGGNMVGGSTTDLNIIIGTEGGKNLNGNRNVIIGAESGKDLIGAENTLIGRWTGNKIIGNHNTAIGHKAAYQAALTLTGHRNTFIGAFSNYAQDLTDSINIGNYTANVDSGAIVIGGFTDLGRTISQDVLFINDMIQFKAMLPTTDPGNSGQLWDDGGTVKISQ